MNLNTILMRYMRIIFDLNMTPCSFKLSQIGYMNSRLRVVDFIDCNSLFLWRCPLLSPAFMSLRGRHQMSDIRIQRPRLAGAGVERESHGNQLADRWKDHSLHGLAPSCDDLRFPSNSWGARTSAESDDEVPAILRDDLRNDSKNAIEFGTFE